MLWRWISKPNDFTSILQSDDDRFQIKWTRRPDRIVLFDTKQPPLLREKVVQSVEAALTIAQDRVK